jgi:ribosome biogenesis GTPase / thiamine phosphate phosphatase
MIDTPESSEFPEDAPLGPDASAKRRHVRAKRVNAMQMWKEGVMDDKPSKERWNREYKDARLKQVKTMISGEDVVRQEEGLVLAVHRRTCEIRLDCAVATSVKAIYRAKLIEELGEFPAVGDRVVLGQSAGGDEWSLIQVQPRRSALKRPGPRDRINQQLTQAANVDQVVIVMTAAQPSFNYGFADRFLLAANTSRLPLIMVLNKMDLVSELPEGVRDFMELVDDFIPISCENGEGVEALRKKLVGKSSVFSGQSGVGKSTLINKLVPSAALRTGEVRYKDGKGRHTTTSATLFDLPSGGIVIDTPGIRALGLIDFEPDDLARCFPGFFPDDNFSCRFKDCKHQSEPGCTVLQGIQEGRIPLARWHSYLRILQCKD